MIDDNMLEFMQDFIRQAMYEGYPRFITALRPGADMWFTKIYLREKAEFGPNTALDIVVPMGCKPSKDANVRRLFDACDTIIQCRGSVEDTMLRLSSYILSVGRCSMVEHAEKLGLRRVVIMDGEHVDSIGDIADTFEKMIQSDDRFSKLLFGMVEEHLSGKP